MKRLALLLTRPRRLFAGVAFLLLLSTIYQRSLNVKISSLQTFLSTSNREQISAYRRPSCSCTRSLLNGNSNTSSSSLCSPYSTQRGYHQRVISISMYGPRENALFAFNASTYFLHALIADMTKIYPTWVLRIYHDTSLKADFICPIECAHPQVDFCNTSALGNVGDVGSYVPPKIWRFIPAGDQFVDIMGSRDLDSPLTQRELDAVNEWLASGHAWHAMRDHPFHGVPMLGGMWGFRPELNRTFSSIVLQKILDRSLSPRFGGRGDQDFLASQIWPKINGDIIAHDSFLCRSFGSSSRPWPTRRQPLANETGCFVGCVRPCCTKGQYPFGECPIVCRPINHTDWTVC